MAEIFNDEDTVLLDGKFGHKRREGSSVRGGDDSGHTNRGLPFKRIIEIEVRKSISKVKYSLDNDKASNDYIRLYESLLVSAISCANEISKEFSGDLKHRYKKFAILELNRRLYQTFGKEHPLGIMGYRKWTGMFADRYEPEKENKSGIGIKELMGKFFQRAAASLPNFKKWPVRKNNQKMRIEALNRFLSS